MPTPRTPNIPSAGNILLDAVRNVALGYPVVNTALAINSPSGTGQDVSYLQDKYSLSIGAFPAMNVRYGPQKRVRESRSSYISTTTVILDLYDRWTANSQLQTTIRKNLFDDLERMAANLESNDSLTTGGQPYVVSIADLDLGDDQGIIDHDLLQGEGAIFVTLTVTFNVLPYDA